MPIKIAHAVEDTRITEQVETSDTRPNDLMMFSVVGGSLFLISALWSIEGAVRLSFHCAWSSVEIECCLAHSARLVFPHTSDD
jgi:hypothetical protein